MVGTFHATGITGGSVEFDAVPGEHIDGQLGRKIVTEDGYDGYFMPVQNEQGYEFITHFETHQYSLGMSDERGNVSVGVKVIDVKEPLFLESDDNNTVHLNIDIPSASTSELTFTDGELGSDFKAGKVQSLDKSVHIAALGAGVADLSVNVPKISEGVFAKLGYNEPINTDFHDQRPYFSDRWAYMGRYIGEDLKDKGWTIQDGSDDDPNVSGGTSIRLGIYFVPASGAIASADGYVELKVIDLATNTYLLDDSGNPVAVRRDYKQDDVIMPELLAGSIKAKGQQKIAFEIDCSFAAQVIEASSETAIYIQVVGKDIATGIAELMFAQHAGIIIDAYTRYYGYNWMNLAAAIVRNKGEETIPSDYHEMMGNGMFVSFVNGAKVKIENQRLSISDDGKNLPVFCVGQIANRIDTYELRLKNLATHVKLQNQDSAFIYALMKWTKPTPATLPILTGYLNTAPQFADGWSLVAQKFIPETPGQGIHEDSNAFTVPDDAEQFAVILYPNESQSPVTLALEDMEVDVQPTFTRSIIASTFPAHERHLAFEKNVYRGVTNTPPGYENLRYTIANSPTELPFGLVSGSSNEIINDRGWNSSGNTWAFEGDGKFLRDGDVTFIYDARAYCGESVPSGGTSNCSLWLAKKQPDGSFVEIPGSRTSFVCHKDFKASKMIRSKPINFKVKANDIVRVFAQSDINDGCYLKSGTSGTPLLRLDIDYDELQEIDQSVLDILAQNNEIKFVSKDAEVFDKILEYNIDTGKMTVVEKK